MNSQLTLKELNTLVKETLDVSFPEQLWVVAEIGELKVNRTGHCYLELVEKDQQGESIVARSRATIWSWQYRFIKPYFESTTGQTLMAGLKVLVSVSIEFHEVYGLSLNIKDIDPNYTLGDMARKRQQVINQLIEEGIFDMNKELELPDIPSHIAIISSPTAAGYEDFLDHLHNNSGAFKFYTRLFEATMQGNNAVASIIEAFEYIYNFEDQFDVVVLIRGGGSQMDLSCFDEYELAMHIAQFPIPVLTGIGHEKDESVADMVAHTKLKTPTAVAGFLIERIDLVAHQLNDLEGVLLTAIKKLFDKQEQGLNQAYKLFRPLIRAKMERSTMKLNQIARDIKPLTNEVIDRQKFKLVQIAEHLQVSSRAVLKKENNRIQNLSASTSFYSRMNTSEEAHFLDEKAHQLKRIIQYRLEKESATIEWLEKNSQLVDPKNILKRGFSITLKNGKAIKNANEIDNEDLLETVFHTGKLISKAVKQ